MGKEDIIQKWLNDTLSETEKKSFEQSEDYKVLTTIWEELKVAQAPAFYTEKELKKFKHTRKSSEEISVSWMKPWMRIAASFLLVSLLGYFLYQYSFSNSRVKLSDYQTEFFLPDSSIVILNKDSELSYSEEDWQENREVQLLGEAFFKVKTGSKFDVETSEGLVSVVGTEFTVQQRKSFFQVSCHEGRVSVSTKSDTTLLVEGKAYQLKKNKSLVYEIPKLKAPSWLHGESSFYKVPLTIVIQELERQYDVSINSREISLDGTYTGSFPHQNLKLALDAVIIPSGYSYEISDNKVRLLGEKN